MPTTRAGRAALLALAFSALDASGSIAAAIATGAGARAAGDPQVEVSLGTPEVVMDYSAMTCRAAAGLDLPDVQARALRRADGSLLLVSGNAPVNYSLSGPDFQHLTRDCAALLVSGDSPAAHTFDNQEWLLSVFRDGEVVHALVHNEYHDPVAPNCRPGVTDPSNPCWYNGITYARSDDGGRTFTQRAAPQHVVAALPNPWNPASVPRGAPPPHGYFTPSNIVRGADGAYYSMFMSISDPAASTQGQCVMRSEDLADPSSWRAWDGTGYNLPMPSPYDAQGKPAPTGRPACTPVSPGTIAGMGGSLTFNTYLERFILVGNGVFSPAGTPVCGSWFSLSTDLLHWSAPQLLMPGKLPYPPCDAGTPEGSLIYPSLIDHGDSDVNFQRTGATPHLYYVRWNQGLDRDLLRVPVTFRRIGTDPDACVADAHTLCLQRGRFRVRMRWTDFQGVTREARAAPQTAESGFFFFLAPSNLEVLIKVLDGCALNGRFWVFFAAATNTGFELRVEDTQSESSKTYTNPLGAFPLAVGDTDAFATCP